MAVELKSASPAREEEEEEEELTDVDIAELNKISQASEKFLADHVSVFRD